MSAPVDHDTAALKHFAARAQQAQAAKPKSAPMGAGQPSMVFNVIFDHEGPCDSMNDRDFSRYNYVGVSSRPMGDPRRALQESVGSTFRW